MERKPAVTQILDEVKARLENITKDNGYGFDLFSLERSHLKPFKAGDLPAINYWPGTDRLVEQSGHEQRELVLVIETYDRFDDYPLADKSAMLEMDVRTALYRAPEAPKINDNPSVRLGGLVDSCDVVTVTPRIQEGQTPYCGVALELVIRYSVKMSDHTKLI